LESKANREFIFASIWRLAGLRSHSLKDDVQKVTIPIVIGSFLGEIEAF